jgi:ankyrin repeat protein
MDHYLTVTLATAAVSVVLIWLVISRWHPKQVNDLALMRSLRKMAFTMPPAVFGLKPTEEFPKVYGAIFEFPLEEFIGTVVTLSDGNASVYSTGTFGVIGGCEHETVRAAAKAFVRAAQDFHDEAETTSEFPYPNPDRIRFYLLTYNGVRFIDTDAESLASGTNQYSTLFNKGHELLAEIRGISEARGLTPTNNSDQKLLNAIDSDDKEAAMALLRGGANPNAIDLAGVPAIVLSVSRKQTEVVKLLIEKGADAEGAVSGPTDLFPLLGASSNGSREIVEELLNAGADVNRRNAIGGTALMVSSYLGQHDVVEILLRRGAEVDTIDKNGYTALMYAANSGHLEIARLLINAKANVNAKDGTDSTPLMFAAQRGDVEMLKLLLTNGANKDAIGTHGFRALQFTIQNRHDAARKLLE